MAQFIHEIYDKIIIKILGNFWRYSCCLQKSLYGLKQSLHGWFGKFNQAVETFGMQKSKSDHSVFYKNSSFVIILLVVYVDDIVIPKSDCVETK